MVRLVLEVRPVLLALLVRPDHLVRLDRLVLEARPILLVHPDPPVRQLLWVHPDLPVPQGLLDRRLLWVRPDRLVLHLRLVLPVLSDHRVLAARLVRGFQQVPLVLQLPARKVPLVHWDHPVLRVRLDLMVHLVR